MENTNIFLKEFLKLRSNLFTQNEKNITKYKDFVFSIKRDVLIEELNSNTRVDFLIRTQAYQRFDNYSWDWMIFIDLKNNYKDKFDRIFEEKINLLNKSILLEKEILDFKLNNFDEYYTYKYNEELENKKMWKQRVLESNGNVIVEWLNKNIISKDTLRDILEIQVLLFKKEKFSGFRKHIDDISFEFDFLTFHNNHVFYWFLLDVYDYLLDSENFKKDFYLDYPIFEIKKHKKDNHYKFMNNLIKSRFIETNYNNYFLLNSPIIESIKEIKNRKVLLEKLINKNKSDRGSYYSEEIEELNETLNSFYIKKKECELIEKCFLKDEKHLGVYILIKENSKNLTKLIWYSLKDRFNLDDKVYKRLKKSKFEVDIRFLTY